MNRLLMANFARLWKSKIFFGLALFMIGYSIFFYRDVYITIYVKHKAYTSWNLGIFGGLLPIGIVLAVFVSFYIGTEYAGGTIRNKIITGHSRLHIYMANLLVCYAAAVILMAVYCITSMAAGLILVGRQMVNEVWKPGWGIMMTLFILMAYTAILVFVVMTDMNTARTGIVCVVLTMLILAAGIAVVQFLEMPEYVESFEKVQDASGKMVTVEKTVYNSKYLSGEKRELYEWAKLLLPSCQVMDVMNSGVEYSVKQPIGMMGIALVFTGAGIWVFRKKDIR